MHKLFSGLQWFPANEAACYKSSGYLYNTEWWKPQIYFDEQTGGGAGGLGDVGGVGGVAGVATWRVAETDGPDRQS